MFFDDSELTKAYRLDNEMKIIDSLNAKSQDKKHNDMIGYNFANNNYRLFWANKNNKEIKS